MKNSYINGNVKPYLQRVYNFNFTDNGYLSSITTLGYLTKEDYRIVLLFMMEYFKQQDTCLDYLYSKYLIYVKKKYECDSLSINDFEKCIIDYGFDTYIAMDDYGVLTKYVKFTSQRWRTF